MDKLSKKLHGKVPERKVKILQFGEGNFLRAFADYFIQKMNDSGVYTGSVAVVQPMPTGRIADLAMQDGLYTVLLEGIDNQKTVSELMVVDILSDFVNPYADYKRFLSFGESEDLEVIISNTTEAGIALDPADLDFTTCPKSFPAKLLALLIRRFEHFKGDKAKGLAIIPCELIDNNGDELKSVLNSLAKLKGLSQDFIDWLNNANGFTNTLVDRIVTGYPKEQVENLAVRCGYIDNNIVKGEVFHFWALTKNAKVEQCFPVDKCGLNVVFASDIKPYKERKVKLLNGAHTALVPVAYLKGFRTVGEAVNDKEMNEYLRDLMFNEICPTINLPKEELNAFALSVLERFLNPFVRHELLSIALNSTTKFKTRLLPTILDYIKLNNTAPELICRAFAALILFHRGIYNGEQIPLNDDARHLEQFSKVWQGFDGDCDALVRAVCAFRNIWQQDLNTISADFVQKVAQNLQKLLDEEKKA